jgi:hypothetical protein
MSARPGDQPSVPDRNLALELVRATEAAAMAAARHLGYGDKEAVDQAAVDAMPRARVDRDGRDGGDRGGRGGGGAGRAPLRKLVASGASGR